MHANVGSIDRMLRIVVGIAILGLGFYFGSWFGLIGIVPILTGIFRICPAYLPFGLSTCPMKEK